MQGYRPTRPTCAARPFVTVRVYAVVVHIGPFTFPTKQAAQYRCMEMLKNNRLGAVIPTDSEDGQFLWHLLQRHPNLQKKLGCGISHFSTKRDQMPGMQYPTTHFMLHRTDSSSTDFSYRKCLPMGSKAAASSSSSSSSSGTATATPKRAPHMIYPEKYTYDALRNAIGCQVKAFKRSVFAEAAVKEQPVTCPLSGTTLTMSNCDVDHTAPQTFKRLVQGWLEHEGMVSMYAVVLASGDNTGGNQMADQQQVKSWRQYHKEHAVLRLLHRPVHWRVSGEEWSNSRRRAKKQQLTDSV